MNWITIFFICSNYFYKTSSLGGLANYYEGFANYWGGFTNYCGGYYFVS